MTRSAFDAGGDPLARRAGVARCMLATVVAVTALCCGLGESLAEGFMAPTGGEQPKSVGFRAPAAQTVVDRQFRLAGAPGLNRVGGRSIEAADSSATQVTGPSFEQLLDRLDRQDRVIAELQQRLDAQPLAAGVPAWPASTSSYTGAYSEGYLAEPGCGCPGPAKVYAPLVADADGKCAPCCGEKQLKERHIISHYVGYDEGFVIRPFNSRESPFELKINGRIQFRHHGFARDVDTWTDNAGITRPVENRNQFDVERARLIFSGMVLDPRMSFYIQMDGDTDGRHTVDFMDYWFAWKFSDLVQMQMGKRKVSASRQWLLSSADSMFVDRAMATDFFRPDRTVGVWFRGDLTDAMHYELMIGNGYRTADLALDQQNDEFGYAFTHWVDLGDDFGNEFSDYECHVTPAIRLGHSLATADQSGTIGGIPVGESDFVRLSDGTVLDEPNALGPGSQVNEFDIYMYSVDAAWKYAGWSLNGEYFFRWLEDIDGIGNIPVSAIFDRGFYVQSSVYLIPKKMYIAGRVSQVKGPFGDRHAYAGAVNWFLDSGQNLKLTFDVTSLDGSPLNNPSDDIQVGDDGLLFRTQFQAKF